VAAAVTSAVAGCAADTGPLPGEATREDADEVGGAAAALGEPRDGFPTWEERVVHVWTNRARQDPAADLASCAVCAEKACYAPRPPLTWSHGLARAARFHSANLVLAGCGLQHASPCMLVSDLGAQYTPGPCDGRPACACEGGAATCGSTGTSFSARIGLFTTGGGAENIARGSNDPVSTFYQWLHEPDADTSCGWRIANGHRANILGATAQLGVGKHATTWTQNFGSGGTPDGIVGGVHYPRTGATIAFRANWHRPSAAAPTARVNVDGVCHAMTLERGTAASGTYLASVSGLGSGCRRYYFTFLAAGGAEVTYPTTGAYGVGCAEDFSATERPPACPGSGVDAGIDAGAATDAGGPGTDAGGVTDAGGTTDAGGATDAGPTDAGATDAGRDAGPPRDGGLDAGGLDAGGTADAGGMTDAGAADAGATPDGSAAEDAGTDAGGATDAATEDDAGRPPDAGLASDAGGALDGASAVDGATGDGAAGDGAAAGDAATGGSATVEGACGCRAAGAVSPAGGAAERAGLRALAALLVGSLAAARRRRRRR
jgi:hypothetical protein